MDLEGNHSRRKRPDCDHSRPPRNESRLWIIIASEGEIRGKRRKEYLGFYPLVRQIQKPFLLLSFSLLFFSLLSFFCFSSLPTCGRPPWRPRPSLPGKPDPCIEDNSLCLQAWVTQHLVQYGNNQIHSFSEVYMFSPLADMIQIFCRKSLRTWPRLLWCFQLQLVCSCQPETWATIWYPPYAGQ